MSYGDPGYAIMLQADKSDPHVRHLIAKRRELLEQLDKVENEIIALAVWRESTQQCACGHDSFEHEPDPSRCAGSPCWHGDSLDSHGYPINRCTCSEYNPN